MVFYEYACFKCPGCQKGIDVTSYENQDFMHRMEKPVAFRCEYCKSDVIFKPQKRIFQIGLVGFIFLGFTSYLITKSFVVASAIFLVSGLMLVYSLLTNKLVLVKKNEHQHTNIENKEMDIKESNDYEKISLKWQYEYIAILKKNLKKHGISDSKAHKIVSDFAFDFSMLHDQGYIKSGDKEYIPKIAFLESNRELVCTKEDSNLHDYALGTASEIYGK